MKLWSVVVSKIEQVTGQTFGLQKVEAMQGGDINRVYRLQGSTQSYFVKLNKASLLAMFEVEALGLHDLASTHTLRTPKPICSGIVGEDAFLVLEYVALQSLSSRSQQQLGEQLAQLHQVQQSYFGWHHDNYIGSNLQKNTRENDWVHFWQEQRLAVQLELAAQNGYAGKLQTLGAELYGLVPQFFSSYQTQASLLHGDLWSGNAAADEQGQAIIYDPACYYGDREADIAMTELFGGYSYDFYVAYENVWPLDSGYKARKNLYNLYHILNHLNLFGSGYLHQAEAMMQTLIVQVK
ncbi:fructosamine kinase family protein [methanotrophic endosymbiont of Bathymodiolus puteoserpentis (Logatchev)]|jgi:fructosamine-3-kinase|uniref:fructosamine kinase family protein n=1 Tax=methanotrophic endosymbiont of Bathymodiolus puteoserpentis (Logatchev) TaxID=343235 RepID=UPI0013CC40D6|nr:fructosamine kinase family protein [methanotrophic endosymbiont of Bathymodiolus puteoserpentis (Logatchev)]SHE21462.1 Ribulosamine/erythrulosamine 3-kinase potentially involved in protein deglycation [methanotrophic endosymbiont of Bathymodiolus puteoserpentis (Logatchev)]